MERQPDIGYIPTPHEMIDAMLTLAGVGKNDILYDLGSGDGRILIKAAKQFQTRGVGIDIDSSRIQEGRENAEKAGVSHLVEFRQADLFTSDIQEATVVILYLLPHLNLKLRSRLFSQLKPGTRIVSRDFDMGDWTPQRSLCITAEEEDATLHYWEIS